MIAIAGLEKFKQRCQQACNENKECIGFLIKKDKKGQDTQFS